MLIYTPLLLPIFENLAEIYSLAARKMAYSVEVPAAQISELCTLVNYVERIYPSLDCEDRTYLCQEML